MHAVPRAVRDADPGTTHMPYAVFLAVATLSCAAYAVLVHSGTEAAAQPALRESPATAGPSFDPSDAPQKSSRETAP